MFCITIIPTDKKFSRCQNKRSATIGREIMLSRILAFSVMCIPRLTRQQPLFLDFISHGFVPWWCAGPHVLLSRHPTTSPWSIYWYPPLIQIFYLKGHFFPYIPFFNPYFYVVSCLPCHCDYILLNNLKFLTWLDAHRQRIVNWINATGGTSSAFDVTTKVVWSLTWYSFLSLLSKKIELIILKTCLPFAIIL